MIHNKSLGLCVHSDASPSKELVNTLHNISTAQHRARDRVVHDWADNHHIPDLVYGRPIHASACFGEFAEHLVPDIPTFRFRHNAQVV
jgi:hypothetical protein